MGLAEIRAAQDILRRHARTRLDCPDPVCFALNGRQILKRGRGRWFYGCTRWPDCRQTLPADQRTGDPIPREAPRRYHDIATDRQWGIDDLQSPERSERTASGLRIERVVSRVDPVRQNDAEARRRATEENEALVREIENRRARRAAALVRRDNEVFLDDDQDDFDEPGDEPESDDPKPRSRRTRSATPRRAQTWESDDAPGKRRIILEE